MNLSSWRGVDITVVAGVVIGGLIVGFTDLSITEVATAVTASLLLVDLAFRMRSAREQRKALVHAYLETEYVGSNVCSDTGFNLVAVVANDGPGDARDVELSFTDDFMKDWLYGLSADQVPTAAFLRRGSLRKEHGWITQGKGS